MGPKTTVAGTKATYNHKPLGLAQIHNPLGSNPPLTTLLASLESQLGFPTSRKQNPNKNLIQSTNNSTQLSCKNSLKT